MRTRQLARPGCHAIPGATATRETAAGYETATNGLGTAPALAATHGLATLHGAAAARRWGRAVVLLGSHFSHRLAWNLKAHTSLGLLGWVRRPSLVEIGRCRERFGQTRRFRAKRGRFRAGLRPKSGQIRSIPGRIWSKLVEVVTNLGNLGPNSAHFDRVRPHVDRNRLAFRHITARSTGVRPISARNRPALRKVAWAPFRERESRRASRIQGAGAPKKRGCGARLRVCGSARLRPPPCAPSPRGRWCCRRPSRSPRTSTPRPRSPCAPSRAPPPERRSRRRGPEDGSEGGRSRGCRREAARSAQAPRPRGSALRIRIC